MAQASGFSRLQPASAGFNRLQPASVRTDEWGRLNLLKLSGGAACCTDLQRPVATVNPGKPGFTAIQHYLVRPFRPCYPLLHGLFWPFRPEKMLSYTTPVHEDGTGRERDGTGTDGTGRDGTGTGLVIG